MDLFRCVVLTALFTEALGGGFTIEDDKTHWTTASQKCTLATPKLVFSSDEITVEIAESLTKDVWVGYYQARTAFEYFGCAANYIYTPMFCTKADPGSCMSACGGQKIIGVFGNECFCFEKGEIPDNEHTMLPKCNKQCDDLTGVVCGGSSEKHNGTTYMSLYRSIGTDISSIVGRGSGNCMYYDHLGFYWRRCSADIEFICGIGSTVWIEHTNNNLPVYRQWTAATVECFANNTRPSTYNNTQSPQTNSSTAPLWTGIVRSQVIYKYNKDLHQEGWANKYCHIKEENSRIVLKFANLNQTKKSLCGNGAVIFISNSISSIPPNLK